MEGRTGKSAAGAQGQIRVISGSSNTDSGVGRRHGAFSGGDIRSALQQLRRQGIRDLRQSQFDVARGEAELRRWFADKHRDSVLQLGTLPLQIKR